MKLARTLRTEFRWMLMLISCVGSVSLGVPLGAQTGRSVTTDRESSTVRQHSGQEIAALFAKGQAALQTGDLVQAEADFQGVLATDPKAGAAYANLGVIAIRRKEWNLALKLLNKAEKLEPKMIGVRLNIGLVEYRRGNYGAAIAPLASVVRDQPDSQQARYLLGQCDVFTLHYADAVKALEPLWPKMSGDVLYLYVLDIAAQNSKQTELDEKVLKQMVDAGKDAPEFHLILAKAFLNREETNKAVAELERAAAANSNLPYMHFDWGMAYLQLNDDEKAAAEFQKDIALEPDLADDYEQLGLIYARTQKDDQAEKSFRAAIQRDPKMVVSWNGLAKLYLAQKKYPLALQSADAAIRIAPEGQNSHFLKGRTLMQMGRVREARAELAVVQKLSNSEMEKAQRALEHRLLPNPELTRQSK